MKALKHQLGWPCVGPLRINFDLYFAGKLKESGSRLRLPLVLSVLLWIGMGWSGTAAQMQPRAFVTDDCYNRVLVIDVATNALLNTIPVGYRPFGVALTPDGSRAYVANSGFLDVSVIDTATNQVVATVPVGRFPIGVAITPDGSRAYVTNYYSFSVTVINTATNQVVGTIPVGSYPTDVTITPDGSRAYITNQGGGENSTVSVIDTATNKVLNTIQVGGHPTGVAITLGGTRAVVANNYTYSISLINTATSSVISTLNVNGCPKGVAITPIAEVVSSEDQITALTNAVVQLNLKTGIADSLDSKLQNALAALQSARNGDRQSAIYQLNAFINSVNAQRDKAISSADADRLIALANQIKTSLGTP